MFEILCCVITRNSEFCFLFVSCAVKMKNDAYLLEHVSHGMLLFAYYFTGMFTFCQSRAGMIVIERRDHLP